MLGAAGVGAFVPGSRATVPTVLVAAGVGNTAFVGAATAEASFQIDAVSDSELDLTWKGWAQQPIESPPNVGWVIEDAL